MVETAVQLLRLEATSTLGADERNHLPAGFPINHEVRIQGYQTIKVLGDGRKITQAASHAAQVGTSREKIGWSFVVWWLARS